MPLLSVTGATSCTRSAMERSSSIWSSSSNMHALDQPMTITFFRSLTARIISYFLTFNMQTIRHSQLFEAFTAERMAELRDRQSSSVFSDILSSVNLSSSEQLSFTYVSAFLCSDYIVFSVHRSSILSSVRRVMLRADMGQIASIALMKTSSSSSISNNSASMSFGSLAKMTYSCVGLTEIMNVVWARLAQCQGRHWRHGTF